MRQFEIVAWLSAYIVVGVLGGIRGYAVGQTFGPWVAVLYGISAGTLIGTGAGYVTRWLVGVAE